MKEVSVMFNLFRDRGLYRFVWVLRIVPFFIGLASAAAYSWAGEIAVSRISHPVLRVSLQEADDTWMGIYMQGIKVGRQHTREQRFVQEDREWLSTKSESRVSLSRLGSGPVEIITVLESISDADGNPRSLRMRTNLAGTAMDVAVEVADGMIRFMSGGEDIKKMEVPGEFYLSVPIDKIIREGGLRDGRRYEFQVLDPLIHGLAPCRFEVLEKQEVLILGRKRHLWHTRTNMTSIVPLTVDEWIDEEGRSWKEISSSGFLSTTSIRMSREMALEPAAENFDIAFSSLLESNISFPDPQRIRRVEFELGGVPLEKIKAFPYGGGSQKIIEEADDHIVIETSAVIFSERDSVIRPVANPKWADLLKATPLVASDIPSMRETSARIVDGETNAWAAAKKIARWVDANMTPTYDVGFAGAEEILQNKRGDCSEYTVLTVALCRAAGIPARAVVGVMYGQGIFAYHMWAEVYVGRWIGLDSKWLAETEDGEIYTDATHIKFGTSALDAGIFKELGGAVAEIIGRLTLEVRSYSPEN